ncbi:hypothetical protein E6C70_00825 [Glaciibacter flavus]|uniref:Uncharacterized protein n=1 Tax=Orlajensenia flava TaxID=2565934 RepID=A0A4S4FYI4_9MICO|nr:hypothetical protein [Glaciibacter flavus]THG36120.1 hypothetical protein E6C70_00825 [Glaciibacter flavus]
MSESKAAASLRTAHILQRIVFPLNAGLIGALAATLAAIRLVAGHAEPGMWVAFAVGTATFMGAIIAVLVLRRSAIRKEGAWV